MGSGISFTLFVALFISYAYADARSFVTLDTIATPANSNMPTIISASMIRNEQLCTLCVEFTSQAINYLHENETESQIINNLHQACSRFHSLEKQCGILVDYYAPLFFVEITTIRPEQFCEKVNLCEGVTTVRQRTRDDACKQCHQVVVEILLKLKDPDTQLKVIEMLLKGCNKVETFVQECKRLVFEYGPLILIKAEKFLETNDICAAVHLCKASEEATAQQVFLAAS